MLDELAPEAETEQLAVPCDTALQIGDGDPCSLVELRAGSWFPLRVGALAVISYLGDIDSGAPADPGLLLNGGDGPFEVTM